MNNRKLSINYVTNSYWLNSEVTNSQHKCYFRTHENLQNIHTDANIYLHDQENRVWSFLEERKVTESVRETADREITDS